MILTIYLASTGTDHEGKSFLDDYKGNPIKMHSIKFRHFPHYSTHETIDVQRNSRFVRVSRQLYAEASPFLHSNRFTFGSWKEFHCFRTIIGPENSKCLQEISIPLPLPAARGTSLGTVSNNKNSVSNEEECPFNEDSPTNWAITGLASLHSSPRLRNVTFRILSNLSVLDLRVAGHFRQLPDSCRVNIEPGFQLRQDPYLHMETEDRLCVLAREVEDLFVSKRWDLIECFPKKKKVMHEQSDDEERIPTAYAELNKGTPGLVSLEDKTALFHTAEGMRMMMWVGNFKGSHRTGGSERTLPPHR